MIANMKSVANKTVDGITMGYIKAQGRIGSALERKSERGDIVQTIIIIAIFVGLAIVVFNLIAPSINTAAKNTANCISGGTATSAISGSANCKLK